MPPAPAETLAAVDIGSNSVRLLVKQGEKVLARELAITRLGKGLGDGKALVTASRNMAETLRALRHFHHLMEELGVSRYRAIATAAVREHPHRAELLLALEDAGLSVEIISPSEEAELAYEGATLDKAHPVWVLDIGGGSTELATPAGAELWRDSFSLGSVRLREMFLKSDPPTAEELAAMQEHIRATLATKVPQAVVTEAAARPLIGVAGTITTLCQIKRELVVFDPEEIHGVVLSRADILALYDKLNALPAWERSNLPGLPMERADVINAGAAILLGVMDLLEKTSVTVSCLDNLDAILKRLAAEKQT